MHPIPHRRYQAVIDRFGERGVMDLVGAVGYYSLVSMVLNVAQVPLPENGADAGKQIPPRRRSRTPCGC